MSEILRLIIEIQGTVQGVGFRPFVFRLATLLDLKGYVTNNKSGATIEIEGSSELLDRFLGRLYLQKPQHANYLKISLQQKEPFGYFDFKIKESQQDGEIKVHLMPDISICQNCLKELKNPKNRRFNYPFINCTDCGPRYSIIKALPYDRINTSMANFIMCPNCKKEYENPKDRRFHAEPISCPDCGPRLMLRKKDGTILATGFDAIKGAAKLIKRDNILAIKGIGGFHLVCDATKSLTVNKLRQRKRRILKPFAVMIGTISEALKCAEISELEKDLLNSIERPIVLLKKRKPHRLEKFCIACDCIAPGIDTFGLFMPYSPIHKLLCDAIKIPLVVTSANISEEPLCKDFDELCKRLEDVFDYVLDYDREIINPVDDSVVFVLDDKPVFIRRARGYAPAPIRLPTKLEKKILALGAQQKNSIAIAFDDLAILSPHIGDLDNLATFDRFCKNIEMLREIYEFTPDLVVIDKHPNYIYRKYAKELKFELLELQHHYAHALSVMCEYGLNEAFAITWDGSGYGDDGTIWGGEFLDIKKGDYKRVLSFDTFRLLGGEAAIKEPKRVALSILFDLFGDDFFIINELLPNGFKEDELKVLFLMHKNGLNSPYTSSVGRIFDIVGALFGSIYECSYEGECGMRLEAMYDSECNDFYDYDIDGFRILFKPIFLKMIEEKDIIRSVSKFFNTLAKIVFDSIKDVNKPIVLSGGVFQNRVLCKKIIELLKEHKKEFYIHQKVPPNDGGISLGQIYGAHFLSLNGD